jgi:hypothetical protein
MKHVTQAAKGMKGTMSELYIPDPPPTLNATPDDVAPLEEFVRRFGWAEFMWTVGQLIVKGHNEATGTRKQALRGLANHVNFIVPGVVWCDEELHIHRPEHANAEEH